MNGWEKDALESARMFYLYSHQNKEEYDKLRELHGFELVEKCCRVLSFDLTRNSKQETLKCPNCSAPIWVDRDFAGKSGKFYYYPEYIKGCPEMSGFTKESVTVKKQCEKCKEAKEFVYYTPIDLESLYPKFWMSFAGMKIDDEKQWETIHLIGEIIRLRSRLGYTEGQNRLLQDESARLYERTNKG